MFFLIVPSSLPGVPARLSCFQVALEILEARHNIVLQSTTHQRREKNCYTFQMEFDREIQACLILGQGGQLVFDTAIGTFRDHLAILLKDSDSVCRFDRLAAKEALLMPFAPHTQWALRLMPFFEDLRGLPAIAVIKIGKFTKKPGS